MSVLRKVLLAVAAVAVLVVGGTWVYINLIREDAPERLTLEEREAEPPAEGAATALAGTWVAGERSEAGYRVDEILFGQNATAVGRTSDVEGELVIDGTTVTSTSMTVDLTTVTSDQDRRDGQFQGRIMNTAEFPTATFALTEPIEVPEGSTTLTVPVTGELTLRGTTKEVIFDLSARRSGEAIEVQGSIPIVFEEWGIPNPSTGPITTEDHGELEFLVVFARA